jgi:hypothetical protein
LDDAPVNTRWQAACGRDESMLCRCSRINRAARWLDERGNVISIVSAKLDASVALVKSVQDAAVLVLGY